MKQNKKLVNLKKIKIVDTVERGTIDIPFSEIQDESGNFRIISEIKRRGYFDIDYRRDKLVLIAGDYVGQIPLTDSLVINVWPKLPINNLIRVVDVGENKIRNIRIHRKSYALSNSHNDSKSIFLFYCECLLAELFSIHKEGLWKTYSGSFKITNTPIGKIVIGDTVKKCWSKGRFDKVSEQRFELSASNDFNQIIFVTLSFVLNRLVTYHSEKNNMIRELSYFYKMLDIPYHNTNQSRLLSLIDKDLSRKIPNLRGYYHEILEICGVVLSGQEIDLLKIDDQKILSSYVIHMPDVFEDYVRNVIGNGLASKGMNAKDGNLRSVLKKLLDTPNNKSPYLAKPDIVVSKDYKAKALVEVKYKKNVNEKDRYQLISHAMSYQVNCAIFVLPAIDSSNISEPIFLGTIGKLEKVFLYEIRVDLSSHDLKSEESELCESVFKLLNSVNQNLMLS